MKIQSNPWLLFKQGKIVKFRAPFGGMAEMLEYWAEKQPEKAAIEFIDVDSNSGIATARRSGPRNDISWRELKEKVLGAAEMLKRRGLKQGDTIAFAYHNHPNILILSLAAWIGGMKTAPLDLKRDDEEMMKYKLELSEAKVVFGEQKAKIDDPRWHFFDTLGLESSLTSSSPPGNPGRKVLLGSSSIVSKMPSSDYLFSDSTLSSEALLLFTSGTTAKPKGAVLTQENLVANADGIADWLDIKSTDKFMIVLPLHHINSTTMSLATLLRGGTIVLASRYTNSRFFEIAARTGATLSSVVPTIIHDQLGGVLSGVVRRVAPRHHFFGTLGQGPSLTSSSPPGQSKSRILSGSSSMTSKMASSGQPFGGLRRVRLSRIQLGSAPVAAKEAEEFVKMTGIPLVQGYGQTETALRSTGVRWNLKKPLTAGYWKDLRSNTIGEEMKWTNVAILREGIEGTEGLEGGRQAREGREGGRQLPEGQEGEICIRGPVIMKKYLKNPAATNESFKFGWFHSGDLGYWKMVDGKRQIFLKGRIKEIIIKAGVNVSPMAVEEKILKSVPGVDQVYAVGVPDERVGEEIGVVVVWKEEGRRKKEEGRRNRGIRGLSEFETPKYWFSMAAEKLPMTSTGKVQRVKLREMFKDCAAIVETDKYMFRVILAAEEEMIEAARQMYNKYWVPLSADKKNWEKKLEGKVLIGAIDKKTGELMGWIRVKGEGKMVTADAVTAANKSIKARPFSKRPGLSISKKDVEIYVAKRVDPIIEFHRRPKAGWKRGAEIVRVVANARPGDTPALGYGVLMEYPEFAKMPAPRLTDSTPGKMLVEAGMVYAYRKGFERVRVLSRPVGLYEYQKLNIKNRKYKLNIKYS